MKNSLVISDRGFRNTGRDIIVRRQQTTHVAEEEERGLVKFLLASVTFFFIGTVHGVLQIQPPIRAWLDSIGSPYGGPGHMIDPLAHAHINVVGGVVLLCMAVTYYLLPRLSGFPLFSQRMVHHTFWWTGLGICGFYSTLMLFGIIEGNLLLQNDHESVEHVHRVYTPIIATVSTVMGIGFWIFFINVLMTARTIYSRDYKGTEQTV